MGTLENPPVEVLIVAVPETAGSALYGMFDVLLATGNIWQTLVREDEQILFHVLIVAASKKPFTCGNGIPVRPDCSIHDEPDAAIIILPEIWLGPDEAIHGRHAALTEWIRQQ